jgi:hypothetical protein
MRQTISGLVAAIAVMAASAVPAMACGGGCSPCGQAYVSPCAQPQVYVEPVYSGCNTGCGWHERLPDPVLQYQESHYPVQQYYYVNQGPTYTGPGNFAPYPTYQEGGYHHRSHHYGYGYRAHYGYHGYRGYAPHRYYGYRQHVLRRYY